VQIVLTRNPQIVQATEALNVAKARTRELESSLYPSVNAVASFSNIGPEAKMTIPGLGSFELYPQNNYDGHIGANYTIYDFGRRSKTIETLKVSEDLALDRLTNVKTELSYQVLQLFDAIIFLRQSDEVMNEELATLDKHLDVVRKKVETGSATDFDVLKTESQRAAAQSRFIDISNTLFKQQITMRQLLGLASDAPLVLEGDIDASGVQSNPDSLVAAALANRGDYTLAGRSKTLAHLQFETAKLENMPQFDIRTLAGFKNGYSPDNTALKFNWAIGVQISMPIFDGWRNKNRRLGAQSNENIADAVLSDLEQRIKTEVLQAKSDVDAALAKIDVSAIQLKLAAQALSIAQIKFESGVLTNTDVLDAEKDYSQARLANFQSKYAYRISLYTLDKATGKKLFDK
jgi:outer membrane protein